MTLQRQALQSARDWIADERHVSLEEVADVDAADLALALIDAALAEPEQPDFATGMECGAILATAVERAVDHIPEAGKKVFTGTLRWENNELYAGKLKVGTTWSTAAGQHGYFVLTGSGLGVGMFPPNIATGAEARAALEAAVLALGDSHGDAHDK